MQMMPSGYNITDLVREAHIRWLKPGEVLFILQNFEENQLTHEPVQRPPSGSLFLFNKRVLRFFRKDGHNWRRKKDGRTVGEAHERLKVGNVEALNCYYAHGELNPNFQRRSYWMLDLGMDHIVLVHYRDITMTVHGSGSISSLSTGSDSYSTPLSRSAAGFSQFREPYDSTSSPSSIEVSSDVLTKSNGSASASSNSEIDRALRRIEAKLSLDDENLKEINTFYNDNHISNDSEFSIDDLDYDDTNDYASQQYPASTLLPHEVEDFRFPARDLADGYPDFSSLFDQGLESNLGLTIPEEQKFMIRDVVPEWGSASEPTKVLIIGSCTCDLSKKKWYCMFGETEVPVEIIQEGVLCCYAPPSLPGKVSLCITSGNRESCSEMREFEYRHKPEKKSRSCEELLLLVRFVQMLLSDQVKQKEGNTRINSSMAGEDSWSQIIEALLDGSLSAHDATDWLVEQLLKDKLHEWLSSKALSKREQGIIHMVSGLGFGWALTPILNSGVGVNFRDINGWTALHWAARFGREKTVAELVAAGAFASAVTDPSHLDPNGKTAASIAATSGHKGLAGYLSEVSLTSHPSLQKQPNQVSRSCADLEAERVANVTNEDLSLKDTLAAVRNATQAAARIQSAFRAHSFRKRKEKESVGYGDEYGILPSEMEVLSKLSFRNGTDHTAALSIQKKYRGWKSRKDFLALRQKVVKIQAHVRGHQVRKNYKVFCWAVGVVEKVVLRWRRKGVGLRGFKQEGDESEDEDEDIVKEFRKEKVDVSIDEAVSRVMSMVDSQPARQQYRRMLQKYCQAKAERESAESEAGSTSEMNM